MGSGQWATHLPRSLLAALVLACSCSAEHAATYSTPTGDAPRSCAAPAAYTCAAGACADLRSLVKPAANVTFELAFMAGAATILQQPDAVAATTSGEVIVADVGDRRLQVFAAADGSFLRTLGGAQLFYRIRGLDVHHATGRIYVADGLMNRVVVLNPRGDVVRRFGRRGAGDGDFESPSGLAVDQSDGSIYVADRGMGHPRVQRFSAAGAFQARLAAAADLPPGTRPLSNLVALAFDPHHGELYVLDRQRVLVLARDGGVLREWGGGVLKQPGGVAVGGQPPVVMVSDGPRVLRFTTGGQLLSRFPESGDGSGGDSSSGSGGGGGGAGGMLVEGRGVALAADGAVFVADSKLELLQKWVPSGGTGSPPHG